MFQLRYVDTCMADSEGRGNTGFKASNSVEARGGPVRKQVGDDLCGLASADGDEVAVAHAELDLGVGGLVGVEELELNSARGKDVLAGLREVIEDEHRRAEGGIEGGRHCSLKVEGYVMPYVGIYMCVCMCMYVE